MTRHFIEAMLVVCAIAALPTPGEARQSARLMAGDHSGANVTFDFGPKGSREGLSVETHRVGNPGALLTISIDRGREKLFSRVLTADDCKFGDDGARCRLVFPRMSPDYRRFVFAFKRGGTAHVEVENAAVMQMSTDISLSGFARKLGSRPPA